MGQIYETKGVAGKILGTKELQGGIWLGTGILGGGWKHFRSFLLRNIVSVKYILKQSQENK
jgi:hypothetical protein